MMEVPYHYQFRIIVIGDTMVGKSSLLKTFSEGTFGEMEPTVGVDFFSKIIEIKPTKNIYDKTTKTATTLTTATKSKQQNNSYNRSSNSFANESIIVKLQIWDTAGQERFKSIVTSYYRNSVGIVLVYDVTNRESYEHLISWFNEACRHVEPTPLPSLSPKIFLNRDNLHSRNPYPLTSTPNVTPQKIKHPSVKRNNISSQSFDDSPSFMPINPISNGDNASSSFNSLTTDLHGDDADNHQVSKQYNSMRNKYKMAYLVIGCKADLESQRQVSHEDGQALADAYGFKFIETSSKMYYNVNQAFQLLAEEIYDKISESGRLNELHRNQSSGSHLTFEGTSTTHINEGVRIGPLIENSSRHRGLYDRDRVRLLEAQPVSGFLGGCC